MNSLRILLVVIITMSLVACGTAMPIGFNLPPLGGSNLGGLAFANVDWNPTSTSVFIDLFKHCSPMYVRKTNNGGSSYMYAAATEVQWGQDMYPASLPRASESSYHVGMCDIGKGASFLRSGDYIVKWDGDGNIDMDRHHVQNLTYLTNNSAQVTVSMDSEYTLGLTVIIAASAVTDPVHNVRVIPLAFQNNYTEQVFHPDFLNIISPYDHIRFTGWQKISNSPKNWTTRVTASYQSQHHADGVAVEHMVDLVERSGIRSVSFSFPLDSAEYNFNFIEFIAVQMPPDLTIYYEAGCAETFGDTDRASETVQLFDQFESVFDNIHTYRGDHDFTLFPSASVSNVAYAPYLINWMGGDFSRVKAVAVPAEFGRSPDANWDGYNSHGIWRLAFANFSNDDLLDVVGRSVLVAEVYLNKMRQLFIGANPNVVLISYTAGPFFMANNYGYRAAKHVVNRCVSNNQFPCVWANTQYNFQNASEVEAVQDMINYNSTLEQVLEDKLIELQRDDRIYDIYLDFIRRWEAIGGQLLIGSNLIQPVTRCPTGGKGCGSPGIFENPFFTDCGNCSQYSALVGYKNGIRSVLPYTSADLPTPAPVHSCTSHCEWGTCIRGSCECFAGFTGENCNVSTSKRSDCNDDVGINLAGIADWSSEWTFVDVFKASRAWISQNFYPGTEWDTEEAQSLSDGDYPTHLLPNQKLGSMMIRDLQEHIPAGVYVCRYDGDGTITFGMDVVNVTRSVGRIEITVEPSSGLNNGIFLIIERTNPADPIRNIRVFMPGFEDSPVPFHPLFLDSVKNYKVFRFMDWANTNAAEYSDWNSRSTRNRTRSYSGATLMPGTSLPGAGVPIEDMILLSNMVGADAWFNMPHLCTDDFVRRYAQLVLETLRPDVKVYVEYSNEVWGTLFNGGQYAQSEGIRLGLASSDAEARFCFYVKRSSEIFTIWKEVFGPNDSGRLEFVYSSQSVQPHVSYLMLACSLSLEVETNATVLAVAPYFGSYSPAVDLDLDIFMNTTLPTQITAIVDDMVGHEELARQFGLTFATYEAGQGLHGSGDSNDLAIQANRDRRMSELYVDYFDMLREQGIELMMQFTSTGTYTTSMTWGLLEASDQDPNNSPKYRGLMDYIKKHSVCVNAVDIFSSNQTSLCSYSGIYIEDTDSCICYYGATGQMCEESEYTEHTDWCGYYCFFHQGTCLPSIIEGTERYWECECNPGYYGHQCHLFDCQENCNFNGACLDIDICSCYPGFLGDFCEIDCGCAGHGICAISTATENATCVCDVGYEWSVSQFSCVKTVYENYTHQIESCANSCVNGICIDEVCTCYAGVVGEFCDSFTSQRQNSISLIGTNLGGISYWSTAWTFVDVMKMSSQWYSFDTPLLYRDSVWNTGEEIHLRPDGYPTHLQPGQAVGKLILRDVKRHAPAGRYVCLYDGEGELDFKFDAEVVAIGKQRVEFIFSPSWEEGCTSAYCGDNGIFLIILKTNPEDPIRNIRVLMPGFEAVYEQIPFHPWFIKSIEGYSTLRFMDWMHTNNNKQVTWQDRPLPGGGSHTQTSGVALEYMIQISNIVGASPWFCMPHMVDDNYVRNFATMVRDNLRSDVEVYVEYSNEVWNSLFDQAAYAEQEGLRLNLSSSASIAKYRFYSRRSVEIFKIWKEVFEDSNRTLNNVLSTWTISPSATEEILSFENASQHATYVGIGPYFDCNGIASSANAGYTALLSADSVLDECMASWDYLTDPLDAVQAVASRFNLEVITYEAGQSLVENAVMQYGAGETAGLTDLLIAVNRHPRMEALYNQYLEILLNASVMSRERPLMHFVSTAYPSKYGSWGALEYTGQSTEETPKYRALREYFFTTENPQSCEQYTSNSILQESLFPFDDNMYIGYPAVSSPRYGDLWRSGEKYYISWLSYAGETSTVDVILHYISENCSGSTISPFHRLRPILTVIESVRSEISEVEFKVPANIMFDGTLSYVIEIRGTMHSNFSHPFSIESSFYFNETSTTCCLGTTVPVFGTCMMTTRGEYSNRRNNASAWATVSDVGNSCISPFDDWPISNCEIESSGCRAYRTAREGVTYGRFKPVVDCVARWAPYPKITMSEKPWDAKDAPSVETNTSSCFNLLSNYPHIPDSCPVNEGYSNPRCEIPDPTSVPSPDPSRSPTHWPTAQGATRLPTRFPTQKPSLKPTRIPTKQPTRAPIVPRPGSPTASPTHAPTASTEIMVNYVQGINGISATSFLSDSEAQNSFRDTVSESIGNISTAEVVINNATDADTGRRLGLRVQQSSLAVSVDYSVILLIQDLQMQDVDSAVNVMNTRITDSITGGAFESKLKSKASAFFQNASTSSINYVGTRVSYLSASPTPQPSVSPTITFQPTTSPKSDHTEKGNVFTGLPFLAAVAGVVAIFVVLSLAFLCRRNMSGKAVSPIGE